MPALNAFNTWVLAPGSALLPARGAAGLPPRAALPAHPAAQRRLQRRHFLRVAAAAGEVPRLDAALDDELSRRPLELDPAGYYIIRVDREARELVAEFYTNTINKDGLACDPLTGEVIPCRKGYVRPASRVYRGRTAKAISVTILEQQEPETGQGQGSQLDLPPVTRLEHANYLGREFQRAEAALISGEAYVQD